MAARPAADWARELTAARVPAGVVNDLRGAFALAQSLGLEPIVQVPAGDERDRAADAQSDPAVAHAGQHTEARRRRCPKH